MPALPDRRNPRPLLGPELNSIIAGWPTLSNVLSLAAFPDQHRLRRAVSILAAELRIAISSAVLQSSSDPAPHTTAPPPCVPPLCDQLNSLSDLLSNGPLLCRLRTILPEQLALIASEMLPFTGRTDHAHDPTLRLPPLDPRSSRSALAKLVLTSKSDPTCSFDHRLSLTHASIASGWDPEAAVRVWSKVRTGQFAHRGATFFPTHYWSRDHPHHTHLSCRTITCPATKSLIHVWLDGDEICAISSSRRLQQTARSTPSTRTRAPLWFPETLRLPMPNGRPSPDLLPVTTIVERKHVWYRRLGSVARTGTLNSILNGQLVMPTTSLPTLRIRRPNLPGWEEDPKAQAALGPTIAEWYYRGVAEYVGPEVDILHTPSMPQNILALNAVPKNTEPFYRLVIDARPANAHLAPWSVRYDTLDQIRLLVQPRDILITLDAKDAYHITPDGGCLGGLRFTSPAPFPGPNGWSMRSRPYIGCTPETCTGLCGKAMAGFCVRGHVFRFAAPHFGFRTAGAPLNSIMQAIRDHISHRFRDVASAVWVDDLLLRLRNPPHPPCGGAADGCPTCLRTLSRGRKIETYVRRLCSDLGVGLSKKGSPAGQLAEFTGVEIDTIDHVYRILEGKCIKLLAFLAELSQAHTTTPRILAQLRGKLIFYSICLPHLRPSITALSREIGSELDSQIQRWDHAFPPSDSCKRNFAYLTRVIPRFRSAGRPIRALVPSSVYGAFLRGDLIGTRLIVLTYDASHHGYAMIPRLRPGDHPHVVVGTLPAHLAQVHRESGAGVRSVQIASTLFDLRGFIVILRNDCAGALKTLEHGSFLSAPLQSDAEDLVQLAQSLHIELLYLHVPGTTLVAEHVDSASRDDAADRQGPACSLSLAQLIHEFAHSLGWRISVDRFASECNALVPRFNSADPEPSSEHHNALTHPDWNTSVCPCCAQPAREVNFLFPPAHLVLPALNKLRADGARAILVLPYNRRAMHWDTLHQAAPTGSRRLILRSQPDRIRWACSSFPARICVLAVDFHPTSPTPPTCPHFHHRRTLIQHSHPLDLADYNTMRQQLATMVPQ